MRISNQPFVSPTLFPLINRGSLSLVFLAFTFFPFGGRLVITRMCLRHQSEVKEQYVCSCQLMEQQKEARGPSLVPTLAAGTGLQLQQALDHISSIRTSLCDIQQHYQDSVRRCRRGNSESILLSDAPIPLFNRTSRVRVHAFL